MASVARGPQRGPAYVEKGREREPASGPEAIDTPYEPPGGQERRRDEAVATPENDRQGAVDVDGQKRDGRDEDLACVAGELRVAGFDAEGRPDADVPLVGPGRELFESGGGIVVRGLISETHFAPPRVDREPVDNAVGVQALERPEGGVDRGRERCHSCVTLHTNPGVDGFVAWFHWEGPVLGEPAIDTGRNDSMGLRINAFLTEVRDDRGFLAAERSG